MGGTRNFGPVQNIPSLSRLDPHSRDSDGGVYATRVIVLRAASTLRWAARCPGNDAAGNVLICRRYTTWCIFALVRPSELVTGCCCTANVVDNARRARPFQGMLLLVIELTRAEIHGHVVQMAMGKETLAPASRLGLFSVGRVYFTGMPVWCRSVAGRLPRRGVGCCVPLLTHLRSHGVCSVSLGQSGFLARHRPLLAAGAIFLAAT